MKKPMFFVVVFMLLSVFAFADTADDEEDTDSVDTEAVADDDPDHDDALVVDGEDHGGGQGDHEGDQEAEDGEDDEGDDDDTEGDQGAAAVAPVELTDAEIAELSALFSDMYTASERFIGDLENAADAPAVADGIRRFAAEMRGMRDRVKSLPPRLSSAMNSGNMPDELREGMGRLNSLNERFNTIGAKVAQFGTDAEVMDAVKELGEASN